MTASFERYPPPRDTPALNRALAAIEAKNPDLLALALAHAPRPELDAAPFLSALFHQALPRDGGGEALLEPIIQAGLRLDGLPRLEFLPLHLSIRRGNLDACALLLQAGADPDAFNTQSDAPLRTCVTYKRADCLDLLLRHGADPALADDRGFTPLHFAAADGDEDLVVRLLHGGAPVKALALDAHTPADIARDCDHFALADLIDAFDQRQELDRALPDLPSSPRSRPAL